MSNKHPMRSLVESMSADDGRPSIQAFFNTAWQEDGEVEFIELAKQGIPPQHLGSLQRSGESNTLVAQYLRRLWAANKAQLLQRVSERFADIMEDM